MLKKNCLEFPASLGMTEEGALRRWACRLGREQQCYSPCGRECCPEVDSCSSAH